MPARNRKGGNNKSEMPQILTEHAALHYQMFRESEKERDCDRQVNKV